MSVGHVELLHYTARGLQCREAEPSWPPILEAQGFFFKMMTLVNLVCFPRDIAAHNL